MTQKRNFSILLALACILFFNSACTSGNDPIDNSVKTSGSLSFTATTSSYSGQYAPNHVLAIWVESSSGTFVKSLMVYAQARKQHLTHWLSATSSGNTTDATTGATLTKHSAHSCTWNGKNVSGSEVGDGTYRVCVEYTESNSGSKIARFDFTKGTAADSQTPASASGVSNVTIKWTPN
ncbi:MAG TPA: DUF2271 domain-containing protein [Paludibacter sp.]|nr:DUF2271 domain-containing protein [Paludibacter sp.]